MENTIERHGYGGAGWLVWGGIILGSRTDLHVQSLTMTGHIYRDVILEQHVRLLRGAEFLFMDDNARPHHANIVHECLQSEDITRMDWPAYSTDLNPIEHVWDMLGRRIAARQPPPTCLLELWRALLDEWCNIPQYQIDNLYSACLGVAKSSCNIIGYSSGFLQICLADKHKDFVRFLWTDSNPRIGEKLTLQVYRFNRVIFGVNSSPFLLAATIKYHIEKYNEIHPITVQHLDSFMYVDDWITRQDTREEALSCLATLRIL
ncbi:transposable element Tcb1 transposase [Trichonephila clavipes]|nr:transposable element Tcb1 transposase [Trichonephila clavipes]